MKLFYAPGACSLASHIILLEIGKPFSLERVDIATKRTGTGADFQQINPKGQVPALQLDSNEVLTEGAAVLQFIADHAGATELAPPAGTVARARVQEVLNFTASELHKAFGPLFQPDADAASKLEASAQVSRRLNWLEGLLADGRTHLTGEAFTVADAYAWVISGWSIPKGIDLAQWPRLAAWHRRIGLRPAVGAAMAAEGFA